MRPVNLIPSDQRMRAAGGKSGSAYVVIGVLALAVAMLAVYVLSSNQVTSRQADAAAAKAEADQLEARAGALGSFTNFATIKQTRLASVMTIAQTRFDWERMMRELSRVLPAGSWLQTVEASTTGAAGDSSTTNQAGTSGGPTAAQLAGCVPKTRDVADMLVRLRELHKVSEVTLNESAKGESSSGGGGNSGDCGKRYKVDVTVTFGATTPKEAPRGTNRVPARLGGGS